MISKSLLIAVALTVFILMSGELEGLTADTIINHILSSYEKQMTNVNDITVVSESDTQYRKRAKVNGRTIYKTRTESAMGEHKTITIWDGEFLWFYNTLSRDINREPADTNPNELINNLKEGEVEFVGKDDINGHTTYILEVKDIDMHTGEDFQQGMSGKVWVDTEKWIIRQMSMDVDGSPEEASAGVVVRMKNYQTIDGVMIPFTTEILLRAGMPEMSPEEEAEMRQNMEEMKRELEEMPALQRRMVEGMMTSQIEKMESMLSEEGMVTVNKVQEVKVNTGLPDNMFDPKYLMEE